jgi:hypothetical protein
LLPTIPLGDPRVLALAKARQQLAHDGTHYLPTWEELTDEEREGPPSALPAETRIRSMWRASTRCYQAAAATPPILRPTPGGSHE